MNWTYLVSVSTALALGIGGTLAAGGIAAQAGHERPAQAMVTKSYPTALPAVAGIWGQASAVGCADADTSLDMAAGTCAGKMAPCAAGTVLALSCGADGQTSVAINFSFDGFWVPAAPQ